MELITLDGLSAATTVKGTSPDTRDAMLIGSQVPHFSWLQNDDVLYDALGGTDQTRVHGSAFGLIRPENKTASGIGFFTDRAGNSIIVVTENYSGDHPNDMYRIARETGLYGRVAHTINVYRGEGGGYFENTIFPQFRSRGAGGKSDSVIAQLTALESQGKQNGSIVVTISGSPRTWRMVGEIASDLVDVIVDLALQVAAPYASSILQMPGTQVLSLGDTMKRLAKGEPASISDLASAASLIANSDVRKYLTRAATAYDAVSSGNYIQAASTLGITPAETTAALQGRLTNVSTDLNKTLQNILNMDTVNTVRANIRSGSAKMAIIDASSIVKVPTIQNLLLSAEQGLVGTIPRVQEIAGLAINETRDIRNQGEHRAMLQMSYGAPTTPGALTDLALRGMVERAITLREQGMKTFVLPASVPESLRDSYAGEISRQTGMSVDTGNSSMVPIIIGGVIAAGAAYMLFKD